MKTTLSAALLFAACLAAGRLDAESKNAIYLLGGLDAKMLTNQDANNYFKLNGQLGPQGYASPVARLGFQFKRWTALEISANFGPVRDNEVTYDSGFFGGTRKISTRWAVTTISLTPAVTWVGPGYVNLLGIRVGQATLAGHVQDDAYGSSGSYDQESQIYDVGILFRTSAIVIEHISIGLEFGYDWTMFNDIKNKNGKGTYDSPHNPERNVSNIGHGGDKTSLDFSGGHIALVLGLWSNPLAVSRDDTRNE